MEPYISGSTEECSQITHEVICKIVNEHPVLMPMILWRALTPSSSMDLLQACLPPPLAGPRP